HGSRFPAVRSFWGSEPLLMLPVKKRIVHTISHYEMSGECLLCGKAACDLRLSVSLFKAFR
ncbi:hypothetical protein, partial [Serratia marcescens]|uniref:hypothetical protein n=1 Tax=Serratia marcescens TaxID=615 RepID=UPI001967F2D1